MVVHNHGGLLPDRVGRAAVIAGCPPLDDPTTFGQLNKVDHALVRMSRQHPNRARLVFRLMHLIDERSAGKLVHRPARKEGRPGASARARGPADASVLGGPFGALLARASADGLVNDEGQVDEYLAFGGPWGFDPSVITAPVRVWQGDADRWVRSEWAVRLAAIVRDGSARECAGEGHLLLVRHWPEVLAWLAT